jgi:hypothetical protein
VKKAAGQAPNQRRDEAAASERPYREAIRREERKSGLLPAEKTSRKPFGDTDEELRCSKSQHWTLSHWTLSPSSVEPHIGMADESIISNALRERRAQKAKRRNNAGEWYSRERHRYWGRKEI